MFKKFTEFVYKFEQITEVYLNESRICYRILVFDPTAVPKKNGVGCKQYGIADVDLLGDFFYQDREDKVALKEELLSE